MGWVLLYPRLATRALPTSLLAMCCHADRRKVGRGLCASCYQADWHRRHPGASAEYQRRWRKSAPGCPVVGCDRTRSTRRTLCETHYRRQRSGAPLDGVYRLTCVDCKQPFEARRPTGKYCSKRCYVRFRSHSVGFAPHPGGKRDERQTYEHNMRRRLAREHPDAVPFDPADIFTRDGWLCWLCGGSVRRRMLKRDPLGPSIDHVVPISRGGVDAPSNVRLAHLICNIRRGAADVAA